jgi:hypothetical protein
MSLRPVSLARRFVGGVSRGVGGAGEDVSGAIVRVGGGTVGPVMVRRVPYVVRSFELACEALQERFGADGNLDPRCSEVAERLRLALDLDAANTRGDGPLPSVASIDAK